MAAPAKVSNFDGGKKASPWEAGGASVQLQSFRAQREAKSISTWGCDPDMVSEPEQHDVALPMGGGKMA